MQQIYNIRKRAGEYLLNIELNRLKRKTAFSGFNSSKTVAILFDASDKTNFELVKKYVKYLRENSKKVKAVGYFNQKEIPEMTYSKNEYDFFSKKDLNWHLRPISSFVSDFIDEEYDILIDFNLEGIFPLYYISTLSKAKFKIGKFIDNSDQYDLMIEMGLNNDLKYFMKNVDHYLLQIHEKSESAKKQNN
ncbi:MAG: hypothetical protein M3Q58_13485 [Bacteroidota bacterium]|nr:hypothetical protein [Bacteroidota bacterium]